MPTAPRTQHALRHAAAQHISRLAAPFAPSIAAQCKSVFARLEEIGGPSGDETAQRGATVDVHALETLPDPTGWGGRAIVPWGHPQCGGMLSRDVRPVRAGRTGVYLQYGGALYDTVRDVFVAARLNRPVAASWDTRGAHVCGCLTVPVARHVAAEDTIDIDAQLELLRQVLRHVAIAAPEIDIGLLANDLFGGQRVLAEHFLWHLELDGFVDHAGNERQTSLMTTAEGTSVLLMLEATKPGVNDEAMSPQALAEADTPAARELVRLEHEAQRSPDDLDIPRF